MYLNLESPIPRVLRVVGITDTGEFAQNDDVREIEIKNSSGGGDDECNKDPA